MGPSGSRKAESLAATGGGRRRSQAGSRHSWGDPRPEGPGPACSSRGAATGNGGLGRAPRTRVGPQPPGASFSGSRGAPGRRPTRGTPAGKSRPAPPAPARARGPHAVPAPALTVLLVVKHRPPRGGRRHGRAHPLLPLAPRKQGARLRADIARVPGPGLAGSGRLQGRGCFGAGGARTAGGRRARGRRGAAAPALRATPHRRAWVRAAAGAGGIAGPQGREWRQEERSGPAASAASSPRRQNLPSRLRALGAGLGRGWGGASGKGGSGAELSAGAWKGRSSGKGCGRGRAGGGAGAGLAPGVPLGTGWLPPV